LFGCSMSGYGKIKVRKKPFIIKRKER